jgi:DNA modification methylase
MVVRGKKTGLCYRWEEAACLPTIEQAEKIKPLLGLNGDLDIALAQAYATRDEVLKLAAEKTKSLAAGACDVLTYSPPNDKCHPCEKPVELLEDLIGICGGDGTILDPFMGSGTTGVACVRLGRKFIGIEREQKYFDIACQRIEAEYKRTELLDGIETVETKTQAELFQ